MAQKTSQMAVLINNAINASTKGTQTAQSVNTLINGVTIQSSV